MRNYRKRRRSRRRNPMRPAAIGKIFTPSNITDLLWGASGLVGTKAVAQMLPIPIQFKTQPFNYVTDLVTAWGLGAVIGNFAGRRVGNLIWMGGAIGVASELLSSVILPALPFNTATLPPANNAGTAGYLNNGRENGMGAYLPYGVATAPVEGAW